MEVRDGEIVERKVVRGKWQGKRRSGSKTKVKKGAA